MSLKKISTAGPIIPLSYPLKLKEESKLEMHGAPKVTKCAFAVVHCRDPAVRLCLIPCRKIRLQTDCGFLDSALLCMFWFCDIYSRIYEKEEQMAIIFWTGFKAVVDESQVWKACSPFLTSSAVTLT